MNMDEQVFETYYIIYDNLKAQTDCSQAPRTKPGFTPLTEILEDFRACAGKLRPLLVNFIDTW